MRLAILLLLTVAVSSGCANTERSDGPGGTPPAAPSWSAFVLDNTGDSPAQAMAGELGALHSISIESDVDGLAARIKTALQARRPALRIETVHDAPFEPVEARLDFRFERRPPGDGRPPGFFVTEALVYKGPVFGPLSMKPLQPARIFFYWKHAESTAGAGDLGDIAFVEPLAAAMNR